MGKNERIIELRRRGYTFREIGELCSCSAQYAYNIAGNVRKLRARPVREKDCGYPKLRNWLNENVKGIDDLCRALYNGATRGLYERLRLKLKGEAPLHKCEIDKILAYTGLRYEEAFADGQDEPR